MRVQSHRLFAAVFLATAAVPSAAVAADPTTADCLAANDSAIDLRNDHKLRAARGQLLICAASSCPTDIRKECLRKVDEINLEIPTVTFEAKDEARGKDLSAVKVTLDGQPLADHLEGMALSVDPGAHTFIFESEGQAPISKQLVITEGQKDRRELVVFDRTPPAASPVVTVAPPAISSPPRRDMGLPAQRQVAIAAGIVGVAGLAIGSAFGAAALSQKGRAQGACPNTCADAGDAAEWHQAVVTGNISTVLLIVGGAGLATAAVVWFTAPSSSRSSAAVGLGMGTAQLMGTW